MFKNSFMEECLKFWSFGNEKQFTLKVEGMKMQKYTKFDVGSFTPFYLLTWSELYNNI